MRQDSTSKLEKRRNKRSSEEKWRGEKRIIKNSILISNPNIKDIFSSTCCYD
jgi:hypothetical protein